MYFPGNAKKGRGYGRGPFCNFCCVAWRAGFTASCLLGRDSHRESGVFSVRSLLSPVESFCPLRSSSELTPCLYSLAGRAAREFFAIREVTPTPIAFNQLRCGFWPLLNEESLSQLVAAYIRLHASESSKQFLDFAVLVQFLRGEDHFSFQYL